MSALILVMPATNASCQLQQFLKISFNVERKQTSSIYIQKFNRRAKDVQPEEQEIWKHLHSTDMSEDSDEEGSFVVYKPAYRQLVCGKYS